MDTSLHHNQKEKTSVTNILFNSLNVRKKKILELVRFPVMIKQTVKTEATSKKEKIIKYFTIPLMIRSLSPPF